MPRGTTYCTGPKRTVGESRAWLEQRHMREGQRRRALALLPSVPCTNGGEAKGNLKHLYRSIVSANLRLPAG